MKRVLTAVLAGACAAGCTNDGADAGAAARVLEPAPPYAEWIVGSTPVVRVGAVDGPPEYEFSRIRYAGRLADGRFVVFDGGSSELRWFDEDGTFLFRAGGRGEGPGEFLSLGAATVTPQDSVVLYDFRTQRLTWFGQDGSLARTLRLELGPVASLIPFGERMVIAEERLSHNFGGAEYNYARDTILVMVTVGDGESLDTLVRRPGREAATWVEYTDGRPSSTAQLGLPFGHPTLVGVTRDRIVLVENGRPELVFVNGAGVETLLVRRTDVDAPPLTADLRQDLVRYATLQARERGGSEPTAAAGAAALLDLIPEGRRAAPFDRLLTDPMSDRVWVRDYVFEWNVGTVQTWTVHDSTGQVLARVTTPGGLDLMQVGPNHIVGVERDELGVESVVVYSLDRAD